MGAAVSLDEGEVADICFPFYACIRCRCDAEYDDLIGTQNLRTQSDCLREVVTFGKVRVGDWRIWKLYKGIRALPEEKWLGRTARAGGQLQNETGE
jgi:hypothetical protein